MSARIPVDRAIADGYGFGFRHFLAVLGIVWLPYFVFALVAVGLIWLLAPGLPRMLSSQELDLPVLMGLGRAAVLIGVVFFVTSAMVTVGVQRKALGLMPRPVWFWYSLGPPVWRMAGAMFVAGVVVFLVALVAGALCYGIWAGVVAAGGAMWPLRVVDIVVGCVVVIYVFLRLFFFLPAVVVAEQSFGLERAWTLGRRNVLRSFIVMVAVVLPVAIVFHVLFRVVFGSLPALSGGGALSLRDVTRAALLQFGAVGPLAILWQFLERIVLLGVTNGAVASAYRTTAGERELPAAPLAASPVT